MAPQPLSQTLDQKRAAALQARLDEAVDLGLLRRVDEPNQYLQWRYDGVDFAYCVKCYRGKRGLTVVHSDQRIGGLLAAGRWQELFTASDAAAAPAKAPAPDRTAGNALGTVTRLPGTEARGLPRRCGHAPVAAADLSPDQAQVFEQVRQWLAAPDRPVLTLGGYAGTGKSTLIGLLAHELAGQRRVGFCAYTGKAANVLRGKLADAGVDATTSCSTIHGLVYEAVVDDATGRVLQWQRRPRLELDLLVVDEASMVSPEILADLLGYRVPILAVGDHGQLPPVGHDRGLMSAPDLRLEVVHRQARGNPIIELAARIRAGEDPMAVAIDDPRVRRLSGRAELDALLPRLIDTPQAADQTVVLCHLNATRVRLDHAIRRHLALGGDPVAAGDRVICLRNTRFGSVLVANGMRGVVESVAPDGEHWLRARIRHQDEGVVVDGRLSRHQFGRERTFAEYADLPFAAHSWTEVGLLYDHGHALTVHKAQGSQWRRVVVCIERGRGDAVEFRRWLYTAVTRAVDEVILVPM